MSRNIETMDPNSELVDTLLRTYKSNRKVKNKDKEKEAILKSEKKMNKNVLIGEYPTKYNLVRQTAICNHQDTASKSSLKSIDRS